MYVNFGRIYGSAGYQNLNHREKPARNFQDVVRKAASADSQPGGQARQSVPMASAAPPSVYLGELGVPVDAYHPNRRRIVTRDVSDLRVEATAEISPDMDGCDY